jgi:Cys-rich repeat protein
VAGPACAYYQPWGGNFCGCNTSSDCANAASGHYCNTTQEFCGCQSDTDCPSGTTCNLAQEQCS